MSKPSIQPERVVKICALFTVMGLVLSALIAFPFLWVLNWMAAQSKQPLTNYGHVFLWTSVIILGLMALKGLLALMNLQGDIEKGKWND